MSKPKIDYWKLNTYRVTMDRHLKLLEEILFGRRESFRKEVTNKDGRLDNKKIVTFITDILKNFDEQRKESLNPPIPPTQKELYKSFLYCAITGFSASSGMADGFGLYMDYEIPELYADLVNMAEYVQRYPMKNRKQLKLWVNGDSSDEDFDPLDISTDDFWGLMEDAYGRLDPETIRKEQEREKKEEAERRKREEEAQKKLESFLAWQKDMRKKEEEDQEKMSKNAFPEGQNVELPDKSVPETEDPDEDYDPYDYWTEETPPDEYWREYLQPKLEAWEKQLPKKNYFCKAYERFKELYFTSKEIDKTCFGKDIRDMIDAYLFSKGLSPASPDDSSALVEDKVRRMEAMLLGTIKRARVLG